MRTKQDDPIDDHNSMDRTSCHQQHRRVHWDEQQLACKVEKGVMFSSSRKGRRSICALDSLMVQIATVQDSYTDDDREGYSNHSNDSHGYIC